MVSVEIKIEATTTEVYMRYHGKTVDKALASNFWEEDVQEEAKIGVSAKSFTHTQIVDLAGGNHYVRYGNSASGVYWLAKIFINGVLRAQGNVNRYRQLSVGFYVETAPSAGEFRFDSYSPPLDTREIFPVGAPWPSVTKSYKPGDSVYIHYAIKNVGAVGGKAEITVKDLDTGVIITIWSLPELAPNERFKTSGSGAYVAKMPNKNWRLEFKVEP